MPSELSRLNSKDIAAGERKPFEDATVLEAARRSGVKIDLPALQARTLLGEYLCTNPRGLIALECYANRQIYTEVRDRLLDDFRDAPDIKSRLELGKVLIRATSEAHAAMALVELKLGEVGGNVTGAPNGQHRRVPGVDAPLVCIQNNGQVKTDGQVTIVSKELTL